MGSSMMVIVMVMAWYFTTQDRMQMQWHGWLEVLAVMEMIEEE